MKFTLAWLKEHLETDASLAAIVDKLRGEEVFVIRSATPHIVHGIEQSDDLPAMSSGATQDDRERQTGFLDLILHVTRTMQPGNLRRAQSWCSREPPGHPVAGSLEHYRRAIDNSSLETRKHPIEVLEHSAIAIGVADLIDQARV